VETTLRVVASTAAAGLLAFGAVGGAAATSAAPNATVPGVPYLVVSPGRDFINVQWSKPSDGGAPITAYRIYRGTRSGAETFLASVTAPVNPLDNIYGDRAAAGGTTYYYQASAVNSVGEGPRSGEIAGKTIAGQTQPPTKPTRLKLVMAGTHELVLQWNRSTAYVSGKPVVVKGYQVWRDGSLIATVVEQHYLSELLRAGSAHTYQVRAIDNSLNTSAPATLKVKTLRPAASRTATIGGVVYDWVNKPLANVVLTFTLPGGTVKTLKTSLNGVWSASALPARWHTLTITHAGYRSTTLRLYAAAHATKLAVTTLTPD
jgi:hypothetical protein